MNNSPINSTINSPTVGDATSLKAMFFSLGIDQYVVINLQPH